MIKLYGGNMWCQQAMVSFQQGRVARQLYGDYQQADRIRHWFRNKYVNHHLKHDYIVRIDPISFCMHNVVTNFMHGISQWYAQGFVVLFKSRVMAGFTCFFQDKITVMWAIVRLPQCWWKFYNYTHSVCILYDNDCLALLVGKTVHNFRICFIITVLSRYDSFL